MASSTDFVQYITDQCAKAGVITTKKMFGDYGIYCDGKIFGLICDDCFYLKPTEPGRALLRCVELRPPYEGAKDYFLITDVDDISPPSCERPVKPYQNPNPRKRRNHD